MWKRAQNRYSVMEIMTTKTTTMRTLYVHAVHVVLNGVIFPQILYDIITYARHFQSVQFFLSIALINSASSYRKM